MANPLQSVVATLFPRFVRKVQVMKAAEHFVEHELKTDENVRACLPENLIEQTASDMLQAGAEVGSASSPFHENRRRLADGVFACAFFDVLLVGPVPTEGMNVRGKAGVSGELSQHLPALFGKNEALKSLLIEFMSFGGVDDADVDEELLRAITAVRQAQLRVWVRFYSFLRLVLSDWGQPEDWCNSFQAAMCGLAEHHYRRELGLPLEFPGVDVYADMHAALLERYLAMVRDGEKEPFKAWRDTLPPAALPLSYSLEHHG